MRTKNPLILGIILFGSIGMAVAGCSQTGSSADRYSMGSDSSDCYSSWGGSRVGTGAASNGSSATDDYSGTSGCVPSSG